MRLLRLLCLLLLVPGCGGEPAGPRYEGTPGLPTTMTLEGWIPRIQAVADGSALAALLDTGSPLTVLSLPARSAGRTRLELRALGLTFPDLPAVISGGLFPDDGVCQSPHPDGLLGGDLLRAFRLGLDYRGKRAFLFDGSGGDPPVGDGTDNAVQVEFELLGGGLARLDDIADPISVDATRVAVTRAVVEGSPHVAVVDTGASMTVVSAELLQTLVGTGRPSLCCETVATIYGQVRARVSRLRTLSLGAVTVKNLPVLIWDEPSFFTALSGEVGRQVGLLVGGSFLRRFAVKVDYPGERLELARYTSQDHVDDDEFVTPGISLCKAKKTAEGMAVVNVYDGSDAAAQGIKPGDRLLAVDGQSTVGLTLEQAHALLRLAEGSTVNLVFANNVTKSVKVERLLPDY